MLAAQFGHSQTAPRLMQHAHDLGFGETALLHRNLLVHPAEKFYFRIPLPWGGVLFHIAPIVTRMAEGLKRSGKLFADGPRDLGASGAA
ncbi:Hypothetical Protein RSKD131_3839 [Cereibacter sphaeroides KD131]|nr:Hypothetical Protein RSKD131_3839 [Cereibacter sphaeroides KD131]